MSKALIVGLFSNFDEAFNVIADIKAAKIPGIGVDDVELISPIEHPEIEDILGDRPAAVPKFTLCGATFGLSFGFLFLASGQAVFTEQPQGGKALIPIPSNIVLSYEMMILFSVLFTIAGFMIGARMFRVRKSLYSENVGIDQVAIELEVDEKFIEPIRSLFKDHAALEVRDEVLK